MVFIPDEIGSRRCERSIEPGNNPDIPNGGRGGLRGDRMRWQVQAWRTPEGYLFE